MRVRFVSQPDRDQLGDEIREHLEAPATHRFWAASAWVRPAALGRIAPALKSFAGRVKPQDCRGLFGVDFGRTTREGLELAAQLFRQARVFHDSRPGRVFHPKVYILERPDLGFLVVGSANLTTGGLWSNYEADVIIELDSAKRDDAMVLGEARSWFTRWWSDPNGSKRITQATIRAIEGDPQIHLPREEEMRTVAPPAGLRTGKAAFPNPVTGLRRLPKTPLGVEGQGEDELVGPGLTIEQTVSEPDQPTDEGQALPSPATRSARRVTAPRVREVYREANEWMREILDVLAGHPDQDVSIDALAKGLGRRRDEMPGLMGSLARMIGELRQGVWLEPDLIRKRRVRNRGDRNAGMTIYRMPEEVARAIRQEQRADA